MLGQVKAQLPSTKKHIENVTKQFQSTRPPNSCDLRKRNNCDLQLNNPTKLYLFQRKTPTENVTKHFQSTRPPTVVIYENETIMIYNQTTLQSSITFNKKTH
jgi:hypothetical protein